MPATRQRKPSPLRPLTKRERAELLQRHQGALELLKRGVAPQQRLLLLSYVVWPSDLIVATQRAAR
jgi:hypothetical protein